MPRVGYVIWDPWLRLCHWGTALLVGLNYWVLEDEAHEWAGYGVATLLALRVLWGFTGPHNARFASFWPTPARLRLHWRRLRRREFDPAEGHNPFGALMIVTLLFLLCFTAISGWLQELDYFWGEDWVQWLHEIAADTLIAAVAVHVTGVLCMSQFSGLHLVRTMITGRRDIANTKSD